MIVKLKATGRKLEEIMVRFFSFVSYCSYVRAPQMMKRSTLFLACLWHTCFTVLSTQPIAISSIEIFMSMMKRHSQQGYCRRTEWQDVSFLLFAFVDKEEHRPNCHVPLSFSSTPSQSPGIRPGQSGHFLNGLRLLHFHSGARHYWVSPLTCLNLPSRSASYSRSFNFDSWNSKPSFLIKHTRKQSNPLRTHGEPMD